MPLASLLPGDLGPGTFAVVLGVPDEAALIREARRLGAAGVPFVSIREPDQPHDNALMALGLRPALRSQLRRHVANLPLFRRSLVT